MANSSLYRQFGKRCIDFIAASVLLLVLSPVIGLVALAVRFKLGGPVLFRQQRPGLNEKPFEMLKFRTMTHERDADGKLLPDDVRLTSFGRFLRSTSLDELPEFINVLQGDMSLIGPRPLLMRYLDRYTPRQQQRHSVRPGITGWAQVNGRNAISWEQKFEYDLWYIEHCSLRLDCKIALQTVGKIVKRDAIAQPGHATMEEFFGSTEQ